MKYIDAEALKKEIAKAPVWTALTITEKIENAPSIDIVRCQDCRHRYMDADLQVWTCTYGLMIKLDGFCNYGERKER